MTSTSPRGRRTGSSVGGGPGESGRLRPPHAERVSATIGALPSRGGLPMGTVTRQAAWRDGADDGWHDDLIWYAAAIHRMKQLTPGLDDFYAVFGEFLQLGRLTQDLADRMAAIAVQWNDPMSLGYQSQVHGTFAFDPQGWPRYKMRRVLWQECAHSQWFFLPWHRAYLV